MGKKRRKERERCGRCVRVYVGEMMVQAFGREPRDLIGQFIWNKDFPIIVSNSNQMFSKHNTSSDFVIFLPTFVYHPINSAGVPFLGSGKRKIVSKDAKWFLGPF